MRLEIPFYSSTNDDDSGPLSLKMVLDFLGRVEHDSKAIQTYSRQLDSGLVWGAGMAVAARRLGFNSRIIFRTNFKHTGIEFYRNYARDEGLQTLEKLYEEGKQLGIVSEEKDIDVDELIACLSENSVPIVLINENIIIGGEGYRGTFAPVSGYDDDNIYIHHTGTQNPQPFLRLNRKAFKEAWESEGTSKDVIIISV